jgi:hypothetical protein
MPPVRAAADPRLRPLCLWCCHVSDCYPVKFCSLCWQHFSSVPTAVNCTVFTFEWVCWRVTCHTTQNPWYRNNKTNRMSPRNPVPDTVRRYGWQMGYWARKNLAFRARFAQWSWRCIQHVDWQVVKKRTAFVVMVRQSKKNLFRNISNYVRSTESSLPFRLFVLHLIHSSVFIPVPCSLCHFRRSFFQKFFLHILHIIVHIVCRWLDSVLTLYGRNSSSVTQGCFRQYSAQRRWCEYKYLFDFVTWIVSVLFCDQNTAHPLLMLCRLARDVCNKYKLSAWLRCASANACNLYSTRDRCGHWRFVWCCSVLPGKCRDIILN